MNFSENGCEIVEDFISEGWLNIFTEEIDKAQFSVETSGIRNIEKKLRSVAEYLNSNEFFEKSTLFVADNARLVRAIYFNKSPQSNWFVTWHQDKTVAVSKQFKAAGWRAWSLKDTIHHVQPPLEVLEGMVTIRVHLDAATKENGCLKVIPNSHHLGILSPEAISKIVSSEKIFFCEAPQRAALIMRPHVLHASSKSTSPNNRRVLHFEFSTWQLPAGVSWG